MKTFFALVVFAIWFGGCRAADTLVANATSYVAKAPIAITLTTANKYRNISVTINGFQIVNVNDNSNGFTGSITFNVFLTCPMTPSASGTLTIKAVGTPLIPGPTTTTNVTPSPTYTVPVGACNVFFLNPGLNPTQLVAGTNLSAQISTKTSFTKAYITLNGQFFCNIGPVTVPVGGTSFPICTGMLPCFLPSCAQFALVGQTAGNPPVIFPGSTVQLLPNGQCTPVFGALAEQTSSCLARFSAENVVDFTFKINANDNINEYSNFEILARIFTVGYPPNVLIARVAGPLCVLVNGSSTYLIYRWVIPCELNNVGTPTFTLSYVQTLDSSEKFPAFGGSIGLTIVPNPACNLSLILNNPGPCAAPYNLSDCGCLAEGSGSSLSPCSNCPACPLLAVNNSPIVPGTVLNFYIHNGMLPSVNNPLGLINQIFYFSNGNNTFTYTVSLGFFYDANSSGAIFSGYKPIGTIGNSLTTLNASNFFKSISVYATGATERIWLLRTDGLPYCGTQTSITPVTSPILSGTNGVAISVGPVGLWAINTTGNNLYHTNNIVCNSGATYTLVATTVPVLLLSSSGTGAYYYSLNNLYHVNGSLVSTLVSAGGPSRIGIIAISASNFDDSLAVIDSVNRLWLLTSPNGTWTQTTLIGIATVVNYNIDNLYVKFTSNQSQVFHAIFGPIPIYNVIPTYSALSLVITSSQPAITVYSSSTSPVFDSCNNALIAHFTVPPLLQGIQSATATLHYTATFPNNIIQNLTSSTSFSIGPTGLNPLQPRNFCPAPCISPAIVSNAPKLGCSSCQ